MKGPVCKILVMEVTNISAQHASGMDAHCRILRISVIGKSTNSQPTLPGRMMVSHL